VNGTQTLARTIFVSIVLASAALPAQADITFLSRDTELSASALCATGDTTCTSESGESIGTVTASDHGFDNYSNSIAYSSWAGATQQSSISPGEISVKTGASGVATELATASSTFSLVFSLSAPEAYTIYGGGESFGGASELVSLSGPGVSIEYFSSGNDSGTLAPGVYTLEAISAADGLFGSSANSGVLLDLEPVPLPASSGLFGAGALALLILAARPRRRAPI